MAGATTFLEIDIEERKAVEGLLKIANSAKMLEGKLAQVKRETKNLERAQSSGVSKALKGFASMVGGVALFTKAMQLANAEWQRNIDLQDKQKDKQLELNKARQGMIRMMADLPDKEQQFIIKSTRALSVQTGVSQNILADALRGTISAAGQEATPALRAVSAVAKLQPEATESMIDTAGALIDLSKVTGFTDARANAGFLFKLLSLSRIEDPAKFGRNAPRSLIGAVNAGFDPRQAAAIFAGLTVAGGEKRGEESGTGTIQFINKLTEFGKGLDDPSVEFMTRAQKDAIKRRQQVLGVQGTISGSETFEIIKQNDRARALFLGEFGKFEAKVQEVLRAFLDPSTTPAKVVERTLGKLPTGGEAAFQQTFQGLLRARQLDPLEKIAVTSRDMSVTADNLLISDVKGGMAGTIREQLVRNLKASGMNVVARGFATAQYDVQNRLFNADAPVTAAVLLRGAAHGMRGRGKSPEDVRSVEELANRMVARHLGVSESEAAAELDRIQHKSIAGFASGRLRGDIDPQLAGPPGMFNAAPGDIGFGGAMGPAGILSRAARIRRESPRMIARDAGLARGSSNSVKAKLARMRMRGRHVSDIDVLGGQIRGFHGMTLGQLAAGITRRGGPVHGPLTFGETFGEDAIMASAGTAAGIDAGPTDLDQIGYDVQSRARRGMVSRGSDPIDNTFLEHARNFAPPYLPGNVSAETIGRSVLGVITEAADFIATAGEVLADSVNNKTGFPGQIANFAEDIGLAGEIAAEKVNALTHSRLRGN
jgi:hypothetical protein